MNKCTRIFNSDNRNTRVAKKSLKRKLKSKKKRNSSVITANKKKRNTEKKKKVQDQYLYSRIKYKEDIQNFCDQNHIHKWQNPPKKIDLDHDFSLYNNPSRVLSSLLNMLYLAKTNSKYVTLEYKGHVSFGALYFIDTICYQIASAKRWRLNHNLPVKEASILYNLKSIITNTSTSENRYTVNYKIKIRRGDNKLTPQDYLKRSKEIRDLIIQALQENNENEDLSHIEHSTIDSAITEHFDNILQHAPNAEFGYLCGSFDKETKEVTLLIYNFGPTIADTLTKNVLPSEVKNLVDDVIANHTKKSLFSTAKFTEENALTLLAVQEGISSKLHSDISRGHGIMDVIEQCYKFNLASKFSIISGRTAIKIDSTYVVKKENILNRQRRIIAFNEKNDIYGKPDENNVVHLQAYFPGVIIETKIPLELS